MDRLDERRKAGFVRGAVDGQVRLMQEEGKCGRIVDEDGERVICGAPAPCIRHLLNDVNRAISYIEEDVSIHKWWKNYLETSPDEAGDLIPQVETAGDIEHHEKWINRLEHVLSALRCTGLALEVGFPIRPESNRYTQEEIDACWLRTNTRTHEEE
jgi:hypothetical protein